MWIASFLATCESGDPLVNSVNILIQTRGKMPFASSCLVLCGALRHLVAHGPIRAWPCPPSRSDLHIRDIVHHHPSLRFHETKLKNIREKDAAACSQVKCGACLLCVSVFFLKCIAAYKTICVPKEKKIVSMPDLFIHV